MSEYFILFGSLKVLNTLCKNEKGVRDLTSNDSIPTDNAELNGEC